MSCLCMIAQAISHHDITWNTHFNAKSVYSLHQQAVECLNILSWIWYFIVGRKCVLSEMRMAIWYQHGFLNKRKPTLYSDSMSLSLGFFSEMINLRESILSAAAACQLHMLTLKIGISNSKCRLFCSHLQEWKGVIALWGSWGPGHLSPLFQFVVALVNIFKGGYWLLYISIFGMWSHISNALQQPLILYGTSIVQKHCLDVTCPKSRLGAGERKTWLMAMSVFYVIHILCSSVWVWTIKLVVWWSLYLDTLIWNLLLYSSMDSEAQFMLSHMAGIIWK